MEDIITNVMLITELKNKELVSIYVHKSKKFIERYVGKEYISEEEIESIADLIEDLAIDNINNISKQELGDLKITYKDTITNKELLVSLKRLRALVGVNGGVNIW